MKVRVKLFAGARELVGRDALEIELANGATISDLRQAVIGTAPELAAIVAHSLWAVGSEYVRDDTTLNEKSDVAMIPPVSGG